VGDRAEGGSQAEREIERERENIAHLFLGKLLKNLASEILNYGAAGSLV